MAVRYLNATGTQALINEIKARLELKANQTSLVSLQNKLNDVEASIPTHLSQLINDADLATNTGVAEVYYTKEAASTLTGLVQQNQTDIGVLKADKDTEGSVDYKIAQAVSNIESIEDTEIEELFTDE